MTEHQKKDRQEIIKEATTNLLNMFQTGKMPEAIALTLIKRENGVDQPSSKWSLGNQILIFLQGTMDARGFNQWKQVRRYVNKGAAAIWILAPMTKKLNVDGTLDQEKVIITGFKPIPVYRFEDTNGEVLETTEYAPKELPPFWTVASQLGVSIEYAPASGNYYGSFSPGKNKISLFSQDVFVYFHELAHAIHNTIKPLKCGQNAEQEIVAETTAAVLCELQGIHGYEDQAYTYITRYAQAENESDVLRCLMKLLSEIEIVVSKILELASCDSQTTSAI